MWKYYYENIRTEKIVAQFFYNGKHVLDVYEDDTYYYTIAKYDFLSEYTANYSEVEEKCGTLDKDNIHNVLKKHLEAGCKIIEDNFFQEAEKIREVIGDGTKVDNDNEMLNLLIKSSQSISEANRIIEDNIGLTSYKDKISFLKQNFDCEVIDKQDADTDELIYDLMLHTIISD